MEFYHLQDYIEAASHYRQTRNESPDVVAPDVARMHEAMGRVDMESVVNVIDQHCNDGLRVLQVVGSWLTNVGFLKSDIEADKAGFKEIDGDYIAVYRFATDIIGKLEEAKAKAEERKRIDIETKDNEKALTDFEAFKEGFYGDIKLRDFLAHHITNDVSTSVAVRRLEHLSHHCDLSQRMTIGVVIEEMKKATSPERPESNQSPTRETQTPQPTPSVQATSKGNATLPDFSHMESFAPTIKYDMSALYRFLIGFGVIKDIDERLFADCITHAHINELWNNGHVVKKGKQGKRNLLQCLFKTLACYYPNEWTAKCIGNMGEGVTRKKIMNPTESGAILEFRDKLMLVLKGKITK